MNQERHVTQQANWLLGDLDLSEVTRIAENEVFGADAPPQLKDNHATELLYELELKSHDELLDSYRVAIKQADAILVFGGAAIAWLATFVGSATGLAMICAVLATFAAATAVSFAFLSRRAILRPALISYPIVLTAMQGKDVHCVRDWIARTMYVGRRKSREVIDKIATMLSIASYAIAIASAFAAVAILIRALS